MNFSKSDYSFGFQKWLEFRTGIAELRVKVWKPLAEPNAIGLTMQSLAEPLDENPKTYHGVSFVRNDVVGAIRLTLDYLPASITDRVFVPNIEGKALISRLVVDQMHRNKGVARQLEEMCIQYATNQGQNSLWAEASETTCLPLQRMGFEVMGSYREEKAIFIRQELVILKRDL